jgi:hypothetical protein
VIVGDVVLQVFQVFLEMLQAYVSSALVVSDVCFKYFIWMLHMLLWLYMHVSNVFRLILQVFHPNVTYGAMAIYACFKSMFQ